MLVFNGIVYGPDPIMSLGDEEIMKIVNVEHPDWVQAPDGFSRMGLSWISDHRDRVSEVFYNRKSNEYICITYMCPNSDPDEIYDPIPGAMDGKTFVVRRVTQKEKISYYYK